MTEKTKRDPLFDAEEESALKRHEAHGMPLFEFMGWRFAVRRMELQHIVGKVWMLNCYKKLHNPEQPGLVLSCAQFTEPDASLYKILPQNIIDEMLKERAAWLIAHWWEHYFDICPCKDGVHDDERGSNFRQAMIGALLWYDRNL